MSCLNFHRSDICSVTPRSIQELGVRINLHIATICSAAVYDSRTIFGSEGVRFQGVQIPLHGAICACSATGTRYGSQHKLSRSCNILFHQCFPGRSRFGASTTPPEKHNPTERNLQNAMIVPQCHNTAQPVFPAQVVMPQSVAHWSDQTPP